MQVLIVRYVLLLTHAVFCCLQRNPTTTTSVVTNISFCVIFHKVIEGTSTHSYPWRCYGNWPVLVGGKQTPAVIGSLKKAWKTDPGQTDGGAEGRPPGALMIVALLSLCWLMCVCNQRYDGSDVTWDWCLSLQPRQPIGATSAHSINYSRLKLTVASC